MMDMKRKSVQTLHLLLIVCLLLLPVLGITGADLQKNKFSLLNTSGISEIGTISPLHLRTSEFVSLSEPQLNNTNNSIYVISDKKKSNLLKLTPFTGELSGGNHSATFYSLHAESSGTDSGTNENPGPYPTENPTGTGQLTIISSPSGAAISVDGEDMDATTPSSFEGPPGTYSVSVSLQRYSPAVKAGTIVSGENTQVDFTLTSSHGSDDSSGGTGSLTVSSTPPGAAISVDGEDMDATTPSTFEGSPGAYSVRVSLQGYESAEKAGIIVAGGNTPVAFTLESSGGGDAGSGGTGSLTVTSTPSGAAISVDGEDMDATTPSTFDGPPGSYSVRISLQGYASAEKVGTIVSGEDTPVDFTLGSSGGNTNSGSGTGSIFFSSNQYGASVILDGVEIQDEVTPFKISNIPAGNYAVSGVLNGKQTATQTILVKSGRLSEVTFLFPSGADTHSSYSETVDFSSGFTTDGSYGSGDSGYLTLQSLPAGADAYLDGYFIGKTPISQYNVSPGTHAIRFEKTGYQPIEFTVSMSGSGVQMITRSLSPL